ncbi:MAG: ATP-binding protein [Azovibrio sp.]|nr:ATP-binding protein [Azovibrio sp.]
MLTSFPHPISALERLVILRWVTLATQFSLILLVSVGWKMALPLVPMLAGTACLALINLVTAWRLRHASTVSDQELFAQLCFDVGTLVWLLYFAGGSSNPFVSLLLLPMTIAAVALPLRYGWYLAGLSLAAYSLLVFFNHPLPPLEGSLKTLDQLLAETCGVGGEHAHRGDGFALHIVGMWLNYILSSLIIIVFLTRQATALREQERMLQQTREKSLRQEKVLALGLQAAGAAHKLGTPLSTMAVLVSELEQDLSPQENQDNLRLLRQQLQRCKNILSDMVASGTPRPPLAADQWIHNLINEWQLLRPEVHMQAVEIANDEPAPLIQVDRSLDQALQNLLDNAANASPEHVRLQLDWDRNRLEIRILDEGRGIDSPMASLLGREFILQEQHTGLGIGFFLSNATIERLGGTVEMSNRHPTGSCIRVCLPLESLAAARPSAALPSEANPASEPMPTQPVRPSAA